MDVLYWALANGSTGDPRDDPGEDWEAQELPEQLWTQSFSDGLNHAFADCDGDGDVDEADLDVIKENFGETRDGQIGDVYSTGDPGSDPILLLESNETVVPPEGNLNIDLSLGSEMERISNFYGIAFTLNFDESVVGDDEEDVQIDILQDTWLNGSGGGQVMKFIQQDNESGQAQVALVRTDQVPVAGAGEIGKLSIVMEDIVVGRTKINVTNIKLIDLGLNNLPAAPSELEFSVQEKTTSVDRRNQDSGITIYPNPIIENTITIELNSKKETILQVQIYDVNGRQLVDHKFGEFRNIQQMDFDSNYPAGIYTMKVRTDRNWFVQKFNKMH